MIVFIIKEGVEPPFYFWFCEAEDAPRLFCGWARGLGRWRRGNLGSKFLAEIEHVPIADGFRAWDGAVVRFAGRIVAAIFADMQIAIAVDAHNAKTDLDRRFADRFPTFPAIHGRPSSVRMIVRVPFLHRRQFTYGGGWWRRGLFLTDPANSCVLFRRCSPGL